MLPSKPVDRLGLCGHARIQRLISQDDRMRLIDDALARSVPESSGWTRERSPATPRFRGESEYRIEIRSPLGPAVRRLNILLRHDGDIQVEYHVVDKRGSPFKMHIVLPEGFRKQPRLKTYRSLWLTFLLSGSSSPTPNLYSEEVDVSSNQAR
jgi:hypothetical protein